MTPDDLKQMDLEGYIPLLAALRKVKRPVSTAPTHTPQTFVEQFVVYESGATRRLYIYVGTAWRYVALT
jgi:hypothetical protein